jgi:fructose/tagatose bisphosphate aldolase
MDRRMTAVHAQPILASIKRDPLALNATNRFNLEESNAILRVISSQGSEQSRDRALF